MVPRQRRLALTLCLVLVTLLVIVVAALVLWLRAPADPLYKGRRLSAYLYETVPRPFQFAQSGIPPSQQTYFKQLNQKQEEARATTAAHLPSSPK